MTRLRSIVLTTGAVVGTVCLLAALAGVLLDVRTLVFRSGSMGPEIPAGSVGLARPVPAADLVKGDIVSVIASDDARVTHRLVAIEGTGAKRALTLQGDANPRSDAETYKVTRADRVFWSVPGVGYVVAWFGSPAGLFLLGASATGILILGFRRPPRPRGGGRRRALAAVAAPAAAVILAGPATLGTWASYTDTSTVSGGTILAHTVQRPDSVTCTAGGNNAHFTWPEKDPRYDYELVLWRDEATDVLVSTNQVTGAGVVTRQYNKNSDFGLSGGLIGAPATHYFFVQVRSWLSGTAAPNRWQSADVRQSSLRVRIPITCTIVLLCSVGNPTCVA